MSTTPLPAGPDQDTMIRLIREKWPQATVATMEGAAFFSLNEKHWPNFATVVWTDDFDMGNPSDLARNGVYRVNIGLGKETFQRLVGSLAEPDYVGLDRLMPHPVYARQRWVAILNPSEASVRDIVLPLLGEAHDRLAAQRARRGTKV
jgi:Family of unknown function (DUF6194)